MTQCNSTEVQHPSCADDQSSIDSNAHFPRVHMLQFHCPQRGSRSCEELLENPSLKPLPKAQEETNNSQSVFPDMQCLILGASRVGKTSLVESLAGKRLISEQANSEGIADRLVDNKSDTIIKGPAFGQFGEFSPFYREVLAELMLFNKGHRVTLSEFVKLAIEEYVLVFLLTSFFIVVIQIKKQLFSILGFSFGYLMMWSLLLFVLSRILCPTVAHLQRSWTDVLIILQRVDRSIGWPEKRNFCWMSVGAFLATMANFYVSGIFECHFDICQDIKYVWFPSFILTVCVLVGLLSFCLLRTKRLFNGNGPHSHQPKAKFLKFLQATEVVSVGRLIIAVFTGYFTLQMLMHRTLWELTNSYTLTYLKVMDFTGLLSILWYFFLLMELTTRLCNELFLKGRWFHKLGLGLVVVIATLFLFLGLVLLISRVKFRGLIYAAFFCNTMYTEFFYLGKSSMGEDINSNQDQQFLRLKILDFAGDKEYCCSYHHLFFKHQALYLIVFNLAEFAEEDFRYVSLHIQRLKLEMKSLCTHVPCRKQILLIGTHRGNLDDNCLKVMDGHLKRFLYREYGNALVGNEAHSLHFFPVENSLGNNDSGIQALQRKIVAVAERRKRQGIGHDIPLSWILIRDTIINLKAKSDAKFCVTVCELQMAIFNDIFLDSLSFSNEMLKYFHEIGLTIYVDKKQDFDLSNWILLNPEKLVDIFIQVFALPIAERTWLKDWDLLQSKGILTKALLQSFLSKVEKDKETIISFLEHYGLICPLENNKAGVKTRHDPDLQPTHFVPSLLPLSADGNRPLWHNSEGDKKLYVFFCNFLPEALFHQLLSRAHKNSGIEFPNGKTVLYRNAGKFWMNPWLSYQLILMKEEEMIEVTYNSRYYKYTIL